MTNTTICTICEEEIRTGEIVHEVPSDNEMIIVCDHCYNYRGGF